MQPILSRITHPAPLSPAGTGAGPEAVPVIRNIIFDFGGVICNLDVGRTEKAFAALGFAPVHAGMADGDPMAVFEAVEKGTLNPGEFRRELRKFFPRPVTDAGIDAAWNALLLDMPAPRIDLIRALGSNHRLFLLSNSNEIHYNHYSGTLLRDHHCRFEDLFEKAWFSFRIGLLKPSQEIFRFVLNDGGLNPAETLFIDDTLMHAEGAQRAGIHAHHLDLSQGEDVTGLFL